MKGKMGDKQRFLHILEAISEIEKYINNTDFIGFSGNSMMRFACIKQIEIIGEAANYISVESREMYADIQWKQIIGLRHILVHEYFGIDTALIWQIVTEDIPVLKNNVLSILSDDI